MLLNLLLIGGITYAAFMDKGSILGTTFSVGSSDIKLLTDITVGIEENNLSDEIIGPSFRDITPYWEQKYYLKIYNKSSSAVELISSAIYDSEQDPENINEILFVEPFEWKDYNNNGISDEGEIYESYGRKTIEDWLKEGINLGPLGKDSLRGLMLKFSTEDIPDSKQGASGIFNFEFNAPQIIE